MSREALPEGVAAVVYSKEELHHVLENGSSHRMKGAVLLAPSALPFMQHIALAATAIFNPFGPTIETFSLGVFGIDDTEWDEGKPVLLRRRLHPFSEPYIQVVGEVSPFSESGHDHLAAVLFYFLAGNGASEASLKWAYRIHETTPSGIIITRTGNSFASTIRSALAWTFQYATAELEEEVRKIDACGPSFWDHATWEMERLRERNLTAPAGFELPGPPKTELLETFSEPASFSPWWQRITTPELQRALYLELPLAWHGAIGQVPGLAYDVDGEEFLQWWRLFRVEEDG